MNPITLLRGPGPLALALLLTACGGGGDQATVSTMAATGARYGGTAVITVNGRNLLSANPTLSVDGPCQNPVRAGTGSDDTVQFTCSVRGLGSIRVRALTADGATLASLAFSVPSPVVAITTSKGDLTVELDPVAAPATVLNFLGYVNSGFYRNVIFHRVVAGSLIQAGGYSTGTAAKAPTQAAIALESNNGLKNLRGTIAAARTDEPDSARAQWYVNVADNPGFDFVDSANPGYAVFGRVTVGLDVVDAIAAVETRPDLATGLTNLPVTEVVITSATQTR